MHMRRSRVRRVAARAGGLLIGLAAAFVSHAPIAAAGDLKIRNPIIETGELEFENNFVIGRGKTTVHELEYGFNDWLKLGVETEFAADPGHGLHYDATALEGFLQLTPQGRYWADVGVFVEYEHTARQGDPRSLTIGPMVQKESFFLGLPLLSTVNLFLTKQMGGGSVGPPGLFVAAQSRVRVSPYFEPGFEYYGIVSLGEHGDAPEHRIGTAFAGRIGFRELGIEAPGGIKYDAAYMRGLTHDTERNTGRVRVEFEFPL